MLIIPKLRFKGISLTDWSRKSAILGGENYLKSCKPVIVVEQKFHKDTGITDNGEAVELLKSWGAKLLQQKKHDLIMGW